MTFEEVNFDLDDKNLFLVDDLKLKADAIRHSILPKLEIITNHTIGLLGQIYSLNALDLSTILKFPNFRKTRAKDFSIDYTSSEAGLGAKRNTRLWSAMKKKNGEQPMIIPFSLTYCLDADSLHFYFFSNRYGLTMKDYSMFYNFHMNYSFEIDSLLKESRVTILKELDDYKRFLFEPLEKYLSFEKENGWRLLFSSKDYEYPINNEDIASLVEDFIAFYPIYDSYLRIASNEQTKILELMGSLKTWLLERIDKKSENELTPREQNRFNKNELLLIAETKIKVMPALRWQVFQRDNWRCVSCGRTTDDGIILHVDHIIPRSKGGLDHLDNYQTLCDICNIGKSNRDRTNLRKQK